MAALGEIDDEPKHRARLVRRLDKAFAAAFAQTRELRAPMRNESPVDGFEPDAIIGDQRREAAFAPDPVDKRQRQQALAGARRAAQQHTALAGKQGGGVNGPAHGQAGRLTMKRAPPPCRGAPSSSSVGAPGGNGRFSAQSRPEWA